MAFKNFTLAEERKDTHMSVTAMLRDFVEQMDLNSIKLMLSEADDLDNADRNNIIIQLENAFMHMRLSGNDILESAESNCIHCYPEAAAFVFRGRISPWHMSFLFHVRNDRIVDIHECMLAWAHFSDLTSEYHLKLIEPSGLVSDSEDFNDDSL